MNLQDQLKNLFPEHQPTDEDALVKGSSIWLQEDPMICKYEKRKGKPTTIIEGYTGADSDFKQLAKEIKKTKIANTLYSAFRKDIAPSAILAPMAFILELPSSCDSIQLDFQ